MLEKQVHPGRWRYHIPVIDHKPASDSAKSSFEEPVPKIYEWSAPRARYFKAIIQMAIGAVAAAIVVGMGIFLALPPGHAHTGKNIQTHVFTTIGVALAIAAGVELAYTLFTHGPDEALDPLMLGLSAALILQLAKVDGFDLKQASSAVIWLFEMSRGQYSACSPCVINAGTAAVLRAGGFGRRIVILALRDSACRCAGQGHAGPMIPICDDQKQRARACPGYGVGAAGDRGRDGDRGRGRR
jgi:hypothetical protein